MKIKTIKLTDGYAPLNPSAHKTQESYNKALRYRVEQITDSIDYQINQLLDRTEVTQLCASREWKVTIAKKGNT